STAVRDRIRSIQPGDIISTHRDEGSGTLWKRETYKGFSDVDRWFALMQGIYEVGMPRRGPKEGMPPPAYRPGNTYLLLLDLRSPLSEPCEIESSCRQGGRRLYQFRRLPRCRPADPNAPCARPNEVVYSDQTVEVTRSRILSPCSVRFFRDGDGIPTPYDRDGTGNLFHMTHRQTVMDGVAPYVPLEKAPASLSAPMVRSSIDDLQRRAMQGRFADNVPRLLRLDQRQDDGSTGKKPVAEWFTKEEARDQDVFSQLICALVGLGYQTQFFLLDASSCGSPQRRSRIRIFVVFAAPGLELPRKPVQTHSHPPNARELGIGWLPNGQRMAAREVPETTPFKYVSADEATSDLPPVCDAQPDTRVAYPDDRLTRGLTKTLRTRMSAIPARPWGMNFAQAWYGEGRARAGSGTMTAAEREFFVSGKDAASDPSKQPMAAQRSSGSYGRVFPNKPFDTIVASQTPSDAKNGQLLHWRENRLVTLMEARRAQGLRDEEVLLGDPATQYRIVGNSVAREVAVALGVVFCEAWA
ncbi:hypothetical protein Trco_005224, partial [Trichoderma cornu-damae]